MGVKTAINSFQLPPIWEAEELKVYIFFEKKLKFYLNLLFLAYIYKST